MKIYAEYAHALRGMYSARFNVSVSSHGTSTQVQSAPRETTPPSLTSKLGNLTKLGNKRKERRRSEHN
jgi:hypothetical protein